MSNRRRAPGGTRQEDNFAASANKRRIVLLSVLLHLLFLAVWDSAIRLDLMRLAPVAPPPPPKAAPLVFDLQQPEKPREVIAAPDDARTTPQPQRADFLSDKNALARDQEAAPRLPVTDNPFSRGDFATHDLPPQPPNPEKKAAPLAADPERNRDDETTVADAQADGERIVRRQEPASARQKNFQFELPGVAHRQVESRVGEEGGLSFNTYDWDFAPYMLALKKRIGGNIFPPLAFSQLGMIDGDTLLRFKIYPDGRLADLELIAYKGHHTLMETSRSAITISAPFPTLPADFPKPYLEVTAKFTYFVKR